MNVHIESLSFFGGGRKKLQNHRAKADTSTSLGQLCKGMTWDFIRTYLIFMNISSSLKNVTRQFTILIRFGWM